MADESKKDAVGNLGLSGYIKVYPSSRSVGTVVRKADRGIPAERPVQEKSFASLGQSGDATGG